MSERIIVLGIMRSGTSLTAELVRQWGAYAGDEKKLWKSDISDPRGYGYMEYIPLQDLNDELLDQNDRIPLPQELLEQRASEPVFRDKALDLIRDMDERANKNQSNAWVWKDARLPLTMPFWMKLWDDPIYVITVRHPAEVILSSAKTEEFDQDNLPFSAGFAYWQYCMLSILTHTQQSHRKIFIPYDRLLNNTIEECTRLNNFLDEQSGKTADGAQQRIETMASQVSGNQRHYHYKKSLAEMEQVTREQRALYDFLRVKVMYADETFRKEDFALYPGWMEYLQVIDMLVSLNNTGQENQGS
jgi:hypothetical protein